MNCKKCGKELPNDSDFCPDCGTTLSTNSPSSDFIVNSGLLTIIAAAFSLTVGFIGLLSYQTYVEYYSYYGYEAPNAFAFWLIAGFAFGAAGLGFLSSVYTLQKKRFTLTLIGPVLMVVSGIFLFIVETVYYLGYSDGFSVPAIPAMVLSVVALVMLFKSKHAFTDYTIYEEDAELASIEPPEAASGDVEQPVEYSSA